MQRPEGLHKKTWRNNAAMINVNFKHVIMTRAIAFQHRKTVLEAIAAQLGPTYTYIATDGPSMRSLTHENVRDPHGPIQRWAIAASTSGTCILLRSDEDFVLARLAV